MPDIIKNARIVEDTWNILKLGDDDSPASVPLPTGPTLLPLTVWQARRSEITSAGAPIGIWLDSHEGPETIADDLARFTVIGVNFPKFTDGRGYSTARLLRQRYGYTGELRAVGNVLHDQLFFMKRVGFDSYAFTDGKNAAYALEAGFRPFSDTYQAATDEPQPHFRRRA